MPARRSRRSPRSPAGRTRRSCLAGPRPLRRRRLACSGCTRKERSPVACASVSELRIEPAHDRLTRFVRGDEAVGPPLATLQWSSIRATYGAGRRNPGGAQLGHGHRLVEGEQGRPWEAGGTTSRVRSSVQSATTVPGIRRTCLAASRQSAVSGGPFTEATTTETYAELIAAEHVGVTERLGVRPTHVVGGDDDRSASRAWPR